MLRQATQRLTGSSEPINGWIALVLLRVVSPAFQAYLESGLNPSWETLRAEASTPVPVA